MTKHVATVDSIVTKMMSAFHGAFLTDGGRLTATDSISEYEQMSEHQSPVIAFIGEQLRSVPFPPWIAKQSLTITARLKVSALKKTMGSSRQAMRRVLDDVARICAMVRGLPLDDAGTVIAYTEKTAELFKRDDDDKIKLHELCNRGGPSFVSAVVNPVPGGPFAEATLTFAVEFEQDFDPRKYYNASVVVIGMQPMEPSLYDQPVGADWTPLSFASVTDTTGRGRFDSEVPVFRGLSSRVEIPNEGIPTEGIKRVSGNDPDIELVSITAVPYTATVAVLGTQQLIAISSFRAGNVQDVTSVVTWASSDATKATVSATGLVTGVAPGSTNITAQWLGITSSACVVTVS